MSKIIFNTLVDMATAATPSGGGYLVAYDLDGMLKQKDQYGVVSSIGATGAIGPIGPTGIGVTGSSGTQSLSQTLAIGNTTDGYSIRSGSTTYSIIQLGTSSFQIDNNSGGYTKAFIGADDTQFYNGFYHSSMTFTDTSINIDVLSNAFLGPPFPKGSIQVLSNNVSIGLEDGTWLTTNDIESVVVFNARYSTQSTSNNNKYPVSISSRNVSVSPGVMNSVAIGGNGLVVSNPYTVYLGDYVNINNEYTLPQFDGSASSVIYTNGSGTLGWTSSAKSLAQTLAVGDSTGGNNIFINSTDYIEFEDNNQYVDADTNWIYIGQNVMLDGIVRINDAFSLPNVDGTPNQVLQTNGSGTVSWVSLGSTPSLSQVLAVGNTDGGYSIIMSTLSYVSDTSLNNALILNDGFGAGGLSLTNDGGLFQKSWLYLQKDYVSLYDNYAEMGAVYPVGGTGAVSMYVSNTSYVVSSSLYMDQTYITMYKTGTPDDRSISIYNNEINMLGNLNHAGWANISYAVISGYTYYARLNVVEGQYPNTTNYVLRTSTDNTNVIFGVRANKTVHVGTTGSSATFSYVNGSQGSGKYLQSDANGNATWISATVSGLGGYSGTFSADGQIVTVVGGVITSVV